MTAKVRTCLWFDGNGEEAAQAYVALLPDSRIERIFSPKAGTPPLVIDFILAGTAYQILNGGPGYPHSWAASLTVSTRDQAETDRLWAALMADGGVESRCGWLKDRFGLSWQIVPEVLPRLLADPDPDISARVMQAMMQMVKIDVAAIEAAGRPRRG